MLVILLLHRRITPKRELRSELEALRTSIKTLTARVEGIEKSQSINRSQVIANNSLAVSMTSSERTIEYQSDDVIKMKFVKLWDLLRYSERTTSKTPTRQKLAIRGKLSLRY